MNLFRVIHCKISSEVVGGDGDLHVVSEVDEAGAQLDVGRGRDGGHQRVVHDGQHDRRTVRLLQLQLQRRLVGADQVCYECYLFERYISYISSLSSGYLDMTLCRLYVSTQVIFNICFEKISGLC